MQDQKKNIFLMMDGRALRTFLRLQKIRIDIFALRFQCLIDSSALIIKPHKCDLFSCTDSLPFDETLRRFPLFKKKCSK